MKTDCVEFDSLAAFAERLVPLCNGQPGLRAGLSMEIREPAGSSPPVAPTLDFIASDETLDRYQEILVAGGWKLDQYQRNPVFQNAHQYGDVIFTLGKALTTEIRGGKLYQRIEFATQVNPLAKIAYGLYRGNFLNAVSVGFVPLRWENGSPEAGYRRKYLEQELLEVSAVCIPANPNALQLGLKAGAVEKADLLDLADLLQLVVEARGGLSGALAKEVKRGSHSAPLPATAPAEGAPAAQTAFRIPIRWPIGDTAGLEEEPPDPEDPGSRAQAQADSENSFNRPAPGGGPFRDPDYERLWLQLATVLRQILKHA